MDKATPTIFNKFFSSAISAAVLLGTALLINTNSAQADDKGFEDQFLKFIKTEKGQDALYEAMIAVDQRKQKAAAVDQEKKQAEELESQFKNPVKIDPGSSPSRGPKDAKITIIEFSDFQCPFCSRGTATMHEVLEAYPNDVKLVFKNLPLPMHPQAEPAAKAALAAGKQNKFWEFHDALFKNQQKLGDEYYMTVAKDLGLDLEKFKADMASAEIAQQIDADKKIAASLNINGTPGFFVNGVAVRGAYPTAHFKTIIDRWLKGKA